MIKTSGYLLLADISGFTAYLAGVELEHAEQILAELYALLAKRFHPYVNDVLVEGGALFGHIPDQQAPAGETMLDFIESAYAAFRKHLLDLRHNITCPCRACQNVSGLDLKFFVHYGEALRHEVGSQVGMMGLDVSLIRARVLKAPVAQATQWVGLALFTAPALAHLQLSRLALPLHPQTVTVQPYGNVETYSLDLQTRYETWRAAHPVGIEPHDADIEISLELPTSQAIVWDWVVLPEKRSQWMAGRRWTALERPLGRMAIGARNHCDHGTGSVMEVILDWRPFDYVTSELTIHPGNFKSRSQFMLQALPSGATLLGWRMKLEIPRWMARFVSGPITTMYRQDVQRLKALIETTSPPKS